MERQSLLLKASFSFLLLLLLSISVVAPGTVITNTGPEGYVIETTPFDYIKLNESFVANFHVYNLSDGKQISNSSINCSLHVYDHNGNHIFEQDRLIYKNGGDGEFYANISAGNFSALGEYAWIVGCNSREYGGFRSSTFEITEDGKPQDGNKNLIYFAIIISSVLIVGFYFYMSINLGDEHTPLKIGMFFLGFLQILFTFYMAVMGLSLQKVSFIEYLLNYLGIYSGIVYFIIGYIFLYILYKVFMGFRSDMRGGR